MKKIKILTIIFDNEIRGFDIDKFRGAVINSAGKDNILFHNHINDKFRYSYPLIQYKQIDKKPVILCLEEGVTEINHFFEKKYNPVRIGDKLTELKIEKIYINQITIQAWDKVFTYNLRNWLGLNQANYEKYISIDSLSEKVIFLEKILTGNILSMMKGMNIILEKEIKLNITQIIKEHSIKLMRVNMQSFDIEFKSNVFLPDHIGLGKSASKGYGIIKKINNK